MTIASDFSSAGAVDRVGLFDAPQRLVGRNDDDVELVDLRELFRFGFRRAGHARQLLVLAEVVLEGDGRERLVLALDLHLFLGLDRLVQAIAPAASRHQAARELVDDDDLAVLDHVVDVELEDRVRAQRLLDMVLDVRVLHVVEVPAVQAVREMFLGRLHAALGQRHRLVLLVDDVVAGRFERFALLGLRVALGLRARLQPRNDAIDFVVEVGRRFGRARNDERRARFVDEDAVDFVHDREMMPALDVLRQLELHVVAQVVEAELVVRPVGDVGGVGLLPLGVVQIVLDDADGHPEESINLAHPFRVAAGQVIVGGDDVDALALERVQIGGKGRDKRLALAGLHLGDGAAVEHRAADELHVEVPHVQHAPAGLANDGKRLGHAGRPASRPWPAARGTRRFGAKLLVRERLRATARTRSPVSTSGRNRFSSRSFWVPMTFARRVPSMGNLSEGYSDDSNTQVVRGRLEFVARGSCG